MPHGRQPDRDGGQVIGRAEGLLMERHRISGDAAFAMLVNVSQRSNTKLRAVCQHLVDTGELDR